MSMGYRDFTELAGVLQMWARELRQDGHRSKTSVVEAWARAANSWARESVKGRGS